MTSSGDVNSITSILSGFTSAESAAEEVIDLVLAEGAKQLYQSYIDKKSFSFSSEAISNLLISELKMCFVRHDDGEPAMIVDGDVGLKRVRDPSKDAQEAGTPHAAFAMALPPVDGFVNPPDLLSEPELNEVPDLPAESAEAVAGGAVGSSALPDRPGASDPTENEVSCSSWALEAEPVRCRIDTWARACVPVRRTVVRPKSKSVPESTRQAHHKSMMIATRSTGKKLSTVSSSSRSPSRLDNKITPTNATRSPSAIDEGKERKDGMIPLIENVEHDDEEAAMREMKEREAKRKREEENRVQRKVSEEAEEAAKLAQVKDQMKNKPYAYDSSGNIIWVQQLQADKLPSSTPVPTYVLRREMPTAEERHTDRKGSLPRPMPPPKAMDYGRRKGKNKDAEFVDTFKKFSSQQPHMMDAMKMSPGVQLRERGMVKGEASAPNVRAGADPNALMTRKDYEMLVQSGAGYPAPKEKDEGKEAEGDAPASQTQSARELPAGQSEVPAESIQPSDGRGTAAVGESPRVAAKVAKTVSPVTPSSGLVPKAPPMPRPEQPVPPPMRRVQLKRDALGYMLGPRERVPTGTGSRFPGCAAAPLLGATMGHGLLPQGSKLEEYYFPQDKSLPVPLGLEEEEVVSGTGLSPRGSSAVPSPRAPANGQIISKNPELVKRLFNRGM
jgi:hypothetical protein